ncbi:MAG TPA: hypothetical protein EYH34_10540 [Planctomycetes bacterium]|nr:hypothetical protein [Planctomycetota bacterium]
MSARKRLLLAAIALGLLALLIAALMVGVYAATQLVPEDYLQALQADPSRQAAGSDRMLEKATALASELEKEGPWSAIFTAEEINGWLAVDLVENHPDALPSGISDPRVVVRPEQLILFCRYERRDFESVLSLSVDAYVAEPNVVAFRICKARAGMLPLPLSDVLEELTKTAQRMNLRIRWRQTEGDPVALITLPPRRDEDGKQVQVTELRLGDGKIYLAGSTSEQ